MYHRRALIPLIVIVLMVSLILVSFSSLSLVVPKANIWATRVSQIDRLHELGFDGTGVVIGIVDTGVDISHQEFSPSSFLAWKDTCSGELEYYDDSDHGTHLAGILVSQGTVQGYLSNVNLQGIAQGVKLVIVRALSPNDCQYGGGNDTAIAEGIRFCVEHGADIICISLGKNPEKIVFDENSTTIKDCQQALSKGVFLIVPAGNDGENDDGDVFILPRLNQVIAVGAMNSNNVAASFSSKGYQYPTNKNPDKKPEILAPGVEIMSTRCTGAYGEISGTSQAVMYVAGILALLLNAYPDYKHNGTKNQGGETIHLFKDIFAKTAKKVGSLLGQTELYSHDDRYGYGVIQAYAAYQELGLV